MAVLEISNVGVSGISGAVPKRVYNNLDYDWISEKDRKMLIKTTGIMTRHIAPLGMTTGDLCTVATEKLIKELQWDKDSVDLLVFVSQSRDYMLPATACILQDKLGLSKNCLSFDVNMGCSGYVYGLSIISGLMSSGSLKRGLLLVGDISTISTSYKDKSAFPIFGDGGTCTALEYKKDEKLVFNLQTDGSGHEAIIIRDGGFRNYLNKSSFDAVKYEEGIERSRSQLELNGLEIFNFSLTEVKPNILKLLEKTETAIEDVSYFVFHQANRLINESIRKKLKLPEEKVPYSLGKYGNTSSASIPITILSELRDKVTQGKNTVLLSGFGVGLSWGSVLLNMDNIVCPEIIEIE